MTRDASDHESSVASTRSLTQADSIAAIATARGLSALAVVRVSGSDALKIGSAVFSGSSPLADAPANTVHFGYVTGPDGKRIDQVVATLFRAPRSSTGEDVVEFSCHGGDVAARLILECLLNAGARLADPGEFTQRAFLNGKLDLAQAEAVADLIHAGSTLAHRISLNQLTGRYSQVLSSLRQELLDVASLIELELDFSEEDVEFADRSQLTALLTRSRDLLAQLVSSYRSGRLVRDGVRVVIGGKPNAGKSTLLSAIVGFDRAIVSPTPGTTRDEIEAEAEIGGVRYSFVDTAGLRETGDEIEAEGVRRASAALDTADVVLYVVDGSLPVDTGEQLFVTSLRRRLGATPMMVIRNKADLSNEVKSGFGESIQLSATSARSNAAELSPLVDWLTTAAAGDLSSADASPIVVNQRHVQHLNAASRAVISALENLTQNVSGDLLAIDLRTALHELGSITGEITSEDVLGQIFSRFCIGK